MLTIPNPSVHGGNSWYWLTLMVLMCSLVRMLCREALNIVIFSIPSAREAVKQLKSWHFSRCFEHSLYYLCDFILTVSLLYNTSQKEKRVSSAPLNTSLWKKLRPKELLLRQQVLKWCQITTEWKPSTNIIYLARLLASTYRAEYKLWNMTASHKCLEEKRKIFEIGDKNILRSLLSTIQGYDMFQSLVHQC